MVLSYFDTKLAYLFYIVEPIATTGLGDPTRTPTGSKILGANEWLDRQYRHLVNIGAPMLLGPWKRGLGALSTTALIEPVDASNSEARSIYLGGEPWRASVAT